MRTKHTLLQNRCRESWDSIPDELWLDVSVRLRMKDRIRMGTVCKRLNSILVHEEIGFLVFKTLFLHPLTVAPAQSWLMEKFSALLHLQSIEMGSLKDFHVIAVSANLCLSIMGDQNLCVLNPLSQEMTIVNPPIPEILTWWSFFCFVADPGTGSFEIVLGNCGTFDVKKQKSQVTMVIYDSKSGTWIPLKFSELCMEIHPRGSGEYVNGCFYWINWSRHCAVFQREHKIWSLIDLPYECPESRCRLSSFNGQLLLLLRPCLEFKVWTLINNDDYDKDHGTWKIMLQTKIDINETEMDPSSAAAATSAEDSVAVNQHGQILMYHPGFQKLISFDIARPEKLSVLDFPAIMPGSVSIHPFQVRSKNT